MPGTTNFDASRGSTGASTTYRDARARDGIGARDAARSPVSYTAINAVLPNRSAPILALPRQANKSVEAGCAELCKVRGRTSTVRSAFLIQQEKMFRAEQACSRRRAARTASATEPLPGDVTVAVGPCRAMAAGGAGSDVVRLVATPQHNTVVGIVPHTTTANLTRRALGHEAQAPPAKRARRGEQEHWQIKEDKGLEQEENVAVPSTRRPIMLRLTRAPILLRLKRDTNGHGAWCATRPSHRCR